MTFDSNALKLDAAAEAERIGEAMRRQVRDLRRKGIVVGISGGIDSSVTAALAARALGAERVFGIFMPEADSDPESLRLGQLLANRFEIRSTVEDIAPALAALKCYERRNAAVAQVIPEFTPQWKFKIVLPGPEHQGLNFYSVVARSPEGREVKVRLTLDAYLAILAATNFKQRVRKMVEYHWADRLNYAVAGTPNRLEYDQGFFVKQGDGAADIKPIAHLYKSQVYQLAEYLGVPEEIRRRPPTTDTYSLPQGQDEFYFSLPYDKLDLCLYAKNHGIAAGEAAAAAGLSAAQVEHAFKDIDLKRSTTRYLHQKPLLVQEIPGVG
ncbi:NAD(+) synthase [Methylibium rhizosphaerae]|uniref:NAD(+) synthase n=1 Tax=Methylibium rhizosphaerae TaxID=2570323 RepID=UPI0011268349|nr:NAD(+) synthase [Methylibium rhizosphaerae]